MVEALLCGFRVYMASMVSRIPTIPIISLFNGGLETCEFALVRFSSLIPHSLPSTTNLIFRMKKLGLRQVKSSAQGCVARKWQR